MVRWQQHHQGIAEAPFQEDGRHGGGRRGVAALRFQHDRLRARVDFAQLLGDEETMRGVADHQGGGEEVRRGHPGRGVLQQTVCAHQRQQLLRVELPRQRPQAGADATRENHRVDEVASCLGGGLGGGRAHGFDPPPLPGTGSCAFMFGPRFL